MKTIPRLRILERDISKAEGTMDDFLRCYAKLRQRAEALGLVLISSDLNQAVLEARDLIIASQAARARLRDQIDAQIAKNRLDRMRALKERARA